ncbi:MAG TPA: Obg family GTPase CgtA, partial [Limnochordia bacterium]|nr:Obg family GTPase CgtA [Limnochordia bacterium]
YYQINKELEMYNPGLAQLPQIVAVNKMDLPDAWKNFDKLREAAAKDGRAVFPISAATGQGTQELMEHTGRMVAEIKVREPVEAFSEDVIVYQPRAQAAPVEEYIIRRENEDYVVEGEGLRRLMERLDLDNEETVEYLQRLFDKIGLYRKLREMQVPDGATVRVEGLEFQYQE